MDIISHALAGAASGSVFGHPLVGLAAGIAPDVVLGLKRRDEPTKLYRYTHSSLVLWAVFAVGSICLPANYVYALTLAWLSHIVLDIPTHGALWAPRLFYPLSDFKIWGFAEWEFVNPSWLLGLVLTLFWSFVCVII